MTQHNSDAGKAILYRQMAAAASGTSSFRQGLPETLYNGGAGHLVAKDGKRKGCARSIGGAISHPCSLDSGNPCRNDGLATKLVMAGRMRY
jgi:hypothetical protein